MELLKVDTIEEAMEKLYACAAEALAPETEIISVLGAGFSGRILAEDIVCTENVPAFNRSTMDGYAVHGADTGGASASIPVFLELIGEVEMGQEAVMEIHPGQCVYVPTGGMIPKGADAVVMVEYCEPFGLNQIAVSQSVSSGKHLVLEGDDMRKGETILLRGRKLRPSDAGVLAAAGITEVKVYVPWNVAVFSTGDEIVSPEETLGLGQMRDVNSYGILHQALAFGFFVTECQVIPDNAGKLEKAAANAMKTNDLILISGGSSKGKKDVTAQVIANLCSSGVLTHGIAVKPGKPTITGFDKPTQTALIGLPGHPVAAMMLFREMAGGLWEKLTGMETAEVKHELYGKMTTNLAASAGRKTYQLVKVCGEEVTPVYGASGLIRTLSCADGYITLEINDEGINKGEKVRVHLF